MPEFFQTYGAWIAFAVFIMLMRLLGGIGNRLWKHEHDTGEEDGDSKDDNSR